jgi:hypothetical protein
MIFIAVIETLEECWIGSSSEGRISMGDIL